VISFGQDRLWRRAVVRAVDPRAGERVLDLAAGTGASSAPLARPAVRPWGQPKAEPDAVFVVPADFSAGMLAAGKRVRPGLPFVAADALRLPFADRSFDAVTISFGLRNVHDVDQALREMLRIVRRGGRLVVCEFSHPTNPAFRRVYLSYLMQALPRAARLVSSNPVAYSYLAESIRDWPDQSELAGWLLNAGWRRVGWRNLTGGIVAVHRATIGTARRDRSARDRPKLSATHPSVAAVLPRRRATGLRARHSLAPRTPRSSEGGPPFRPARVAVAHAACVA
jgi:demethylmenaquinone methyltransferase / 2-methoxy-6-polyprenyl-1,4-benzoquinol methylase